MEADKQAQPTHDDAGGRVPMAPEAAGSPGSLSRRKLLALGWMAPVVVAMPLTGWSANISGGETTPVTSRTNPPFVGPPPISSHPRNRRRGWHRLGDLF